MACTARRSLCVAQALGGSASTLVLLWLGLLTGTAQADDDLYSTEFWPKLEVYYAIEERSRVLFTAAGTRASEAAAEGSAVSFQDAQFSVNFDYTLAPILRKDVPQSEWSKNRLLWARLGFEYGSSLSSGTDAFRSYTGIVELNSRMPLGDDIWLTNRLRVDFRNLNGEPSQRYRVRIGATGSATVFDHPYAPFADVEALYDTRYAQWSRLVLKGGFETPIAEGWRVEPYIAVQLNTPDEVVSRVLGIGLTLKAYLP
jgi:hypothetical protein